MVAPSSVHLKEGEKRDPRLTMSRIVRCQRLRAEAHADEDGGEDREDVGLHGARQQVRRGHA